MKYQVNKIRFLQCLFVWIIFVCTCSAADNENEDGYKLCMGTTRGRSHTGSSAERRYEDYKVRYENCTFLSGNLEIVFLDEKDDYDLSFLSTIREVTGYVLIHAVYSDVLPLTSLRVIRGGEVYVQGDDYYSLYVDYNFKAGSSTVGIKELQLTSLYEIMNGSVMIFNNYQLCHVNTIDWEDILEPEGMSYTIKLDNRTTSGGMDRACPKCHQSCNVTVRNEETGQLESTRHCWGEGPEMCQKLTRRTCNLSCSNRCFGEMPNQCCNSECAGGCTGPKNTECWACKHFKNGDECVPYCPRATVYDGQKYQYVENPDAKFAFGTLCVEKCPENLIVDNQGCVKSCGDGRIPDPETRVCKACDGPCPKSCKGLEPNEFINANNIKSFENCTIIEGSISIMKNTFEGDAYNNISALHPSNLSVFETVREITGYIKIQGEHLEFTSLSFFKNLTTIQGRELDRYTQSSLYIYMTPLQSLELTSLQSVKNGDIVILVNEDLCYANIVNWTKLVESKKSTNQQINVKDNKNQKDCRKEGHVCHDQCSADGCWGAGNNQCLSCKNFKMGDRCVNSCSEHDGVYQVNKTCQSCHEECESSCSGNASNQCDACKHFKDGPFCVPSCPDSKYPDENNICEECHPFCADWGGPRCDGPRNTIGPDGCKQCNKIELGDGNNITRCLNSSREGCENGYFLSPTRQYHGVLACRKCHPYCTTCFGDSAAACDECKHFREEDKCVKNCSSNHFAMGDQCLRCHDRCESCYGPSNSECFKCRQYKIYFEPSEDDPEQQKQFNCTDVCPKWKPLKTTENDENGHTSDTVCVPNPATAKTGPPNLVPIIVSVLVTVIGLFIVIGLTAYFCTRRARALESKELLAARMSGMCEDSEFTPLTPTNAKPDMATLRLIKESTLKKGSMVGSGAFGTVYKGFWYPEGENVKIPVAIKVLQEGTSANQNRELLEEARVMASVKNRYCVSVIGVCMTAQIMLVAPYMPLGCLLDYVRKNQENIGSKVLLDWCTQIASGMSYLEERGIVHRDLAARNVLVQNPKRVRVTDFGLAKLLEHNEEVFHASGGKMPIKWLALECMQHRIFTHKSDVWSFGVTMWELFTYGQRPYENIRARDIPELLEKGERLPQPPICTIDVYMIMIKCWMLDAVSRPSFKELAEEFAKMARDPGRYLVIRGDSLMRLPSHSYDKQVFRNMSVTHDGPEEIMEAEDYLMPAGDEVVGEGTSPPTRHSHLRPHHHNSHRHPNGTLEKVKEENSNGYDNERSRGGPPVRNSMDTAIPPGGGGLGDAPIKYSSLEAAAAQRKQRAETSPARDSLKSRYSSDPCRVIAPMPAFSPVGEEPDFPSVPAPPTPIEKQSFNLDMPDGGGDTGTGSRKNRKSKHLQVPVDEDDYLQPSSASHPKYMDLVQDDYLPPSPSRKTPEFDPLDLPPPPPDPPGYNPSNFPNMFAENPEYFEEMNNNDDNDVEASETDPLTNGNTSPMRSPMEKDRVHSLSSESEGAHSENDYYNDTDRLNKKRRTPPSSLNSKHRPTGNGSASINASRTNPTAKYVV